MNKEQITKTCVSAAAVLLTGAYACGLFSGGSMTYQTPKIDRRVKDGVYSAQKTNNFSTVRVDMTIENRAIADCDAWHYVGTFSYPNIIPNNHFL